MSVKSLAYVVLRCADLERSREFYEALGLQMAPEQHGKGSRHYSSTAGGVLLELYPLTGLSTSGLRIGLVVSDLDRVVESMKVWGAPVSRADGIAVVTDPDGHQIALERAPAGPAG